MYILLHDVQIIGYYSLHIKYILMTYHSKAILLIQGQEFLIFTIITLMKILILKLLKSSNLMKIILTYFISNALVKVFGLFSSGKRFLL